MNLIDGAVVLSGALDITFFLLLTGMALAFIRLILGPTAADRVVALDLISTLVVASLAAHSIRTGRSAYLDVAIGYALVSYLGTIALARFVERTNEAARDRGLAREDSGDA